MCVFFLNCVSSLPDNKICIVCYSSPKLRWRGRGQGAFLPVSGVVRRQQPVRGAIPGHPLAQNCKSICIQ